LSQRVLSPFSRLHLVDVCPLLRAILLEEEIEGNVCGGNEQRRASDSYWSVCSDGGHSVCKLPDGRSIFTELGNVSDMLFVADDDRDIDQRSSRSGP